MSRKPPQGREKPASLDGGAGFVVLPLASWAWALALLTRCAYLLRSLDRRETRELADEVRDFIRTGGKRPS